MSFSAAFEEAKAWRHIRHAVRVVLSIPGSSPPAAAHGLHKQSVRVALMEACEKEPDMDLQVDLFAKTELEVRRPVQCEGISRGPARMTEVAVSGSVNPQFDWGRLLSTAGNIAKTALPVVAGLL
jgi:hypothetical protein